MAAKKETYSQAMERLEKIVRQIDNNELDIDTLSEKIKEANEIIAFCTEKLTKADREVEISVTAYGANWKSAVMNISICTWQLLVCTMVRKLLKV